MGAKLNDVFDKETIARQEAVAEIEYKDIDREIRVEDLKLKQVETELKREQLESNKQDREARKDYAIKLFVFLVIFIFFVVVIVFLCGVENVRFSLNDPVLIALLTTSSANIVGVFIFVVKYLFPAK